MAATNDSLVWLITGATSGLGAALAITALKSGHKVIATARNVLKDSEQFRSVNQLGGKWIELDVTAPDVEKRVAEAVEIFGRLDVVVNNAGYSILGALEDISDEEALAQMQTNFFGPMKVIRAALPSMRAQKSGTIVNVSSIAGIHALPTATLYAGSKFALEGMSESLSKELEPFNIRVLIVEPGAFKTNFLKATVKPKIGMSKPYEGTVVDNVLRFFEKLDGTQKGDTQKGAERIFESVTGTGMAGNAELRKYLRLPLGSDCHQRFQTKVSGLQENLDKLKEVSLSTDSEGGQGSTFGGSD